MIEPNSRPTTVRKFVASLLHPALEMIELGADVVDRMATQAHIDRRSDAKFNEALRWFRLCRFDPENARQYALLGEAALAEGIKLDELEDGPRAGATASGLAVQTIGHATVYQLEEFNGVKHLPAARPDPRGPEGPGAAA